MSEQSVTIDYTNWRGERSLRRVQPISIDFSSNKWHPIAQWLMVAIDLDDNNYPEKAFAMKDIHSWKVDAK